MSDSKTKFINFAEIFDYLTSRSFLKNIGLMILLVVLIIFSIFQWLKVYTNHGQRLLLEDYIDTNIDEAREDAENNSFQLIVNDSTHIVGKPGGIILNQNPKGGSYIKENRKIYVTITKYSPDMIALVDLPRMYGEGYVMKSRELNSRQIKTNIKEFKYDALSNSTILEVWYKGELIIDDKKRNDEVEIEKGSTLEMVVSQPEGGSRVIPDLRDKTLSAAKFLIQVNDFMVGDVVKVGEIEDESSAIVTEQYPAADGVATLTTGSKINLVVKLPDQ